MLKEYINYAALAVQREVLENLRSTIELKVKSEESRLILDRNTLANEHKIAIQRLNYSLQVANAAGIKKPVYSNGQAVKDDPDYSIALGADGLAQKLAIERSITDVTALNAAIQNREYRLAELKKLNGGRGFPAVPLSDGTFAADEKRRAGKSAGTYPCRDAGLYHCLRDGAGA